MKYVGNRNGLTIIELTIAVVSASILITIVFAAWNFISVSTATRQRRTKIQSECARVSKMVTDQIQRSEGVLKYDRNSVTLLSDGAGDTVTYRLNGTAIERNGTAISFIMPEVSVSEFSLENQNRTNDAQPYLFLLTLSLQSVMDDTATVQSTVLGRRPEERASQRGNDFMW